MPDVFLSNLCIIPARCDGPISINDGKVFSKISTRVDSLTLGAGCTIRFAGLSNPMM